LSWRVPPDGFSSKEREGGLAWQTSITFFLRLEEGGKFLEKQAEKNALGGGKDADRRYGKYPSGTGKLRLEEE